MRLLALLIAGLGLVAVPAVAQNQDPPAESSRRNLPPQDLNEARTLNTETLGQAIAFERAKVQRGQRAAATGSRRSASGEVGPDYVGPSGTSSSRADPVDQNTVPAPGAKEYRETKDKEEAKKEPKR
jgi:hypothetical protein